MTEPHFSVIITAYNRPELLVGAVKSVLGQTYPDFEIIVVDDGSEPPLEGVVVDFIEDERVRYVRIDNGGPGRARRLGAQRAHGRWLCFLDDDDYFLPHHLQTLAPHTGDEQQLITTQLRGETDTGAIITSKISDPLTIRTFWQEPVGLPTFAIPRSAALRWPSSDAAIIEDFEWLNRLMIHLPCLVLPEVTMVFRQHSTNRTTQLAELEHLYQREDVINRLYRIEDIRRQVPFSLYQDLLNHQQLHWVRQALRAGKLKAAARGMQRASKTTSIRSWRQWLSTAKVLVSQLFVRGFRLRKH